MIDYEEWEKEDLVRRCYQLEKQLRQAVARSSENSWELSLLEQERAEQEQWERSKQGIFG